jgi:hypothetical protein
MSELSRRKFLTWASLGAAAAGGLATGLVAVPGLAKLSGRAREAPAVPLDNNSFADALVAHVRDFRTGEITVMAGTREVVYRDPDLVARLVSVSRNAVGR